MLLRSNISSEGAPSEGRIAGGSEASDLFAQLFKADTERKLPAKPELFFVNFLFLKESSAEGYMEHRCRVRRVFVGVKEAVKEVWAR